MKNKYLKEGLFLYDFKNKKMAVEDKIEYMFNRLSKMFEYENLPETIPQRNLELMLMWCGQVAWIEKDGKLYVVNGGIGGPPDVYYEGTLYTFANPALNYSASLKIGEDCIVMNNDSLREGLIPLCKRYATLLTEAELSLSNAITMARATNAIAADNDTSKASATLFLENLKNGELSVISTSQFSEGIKSISIGGDVASNITNLIELIQYIKASWFNELGLNSNYNMKRESLNSAESQMNFDSLLPLVEDMLTQRENAIGLINEKWGLNIKVNFSSAWKNLIEEMESIDDKELEESEEEEKESEGGEDVDGNEED